MRKQDIHNKDYFEGVLQLRNATRELIEFVEHQIRKGNVHIAKKKKVRGGIDYYVGDNKWLVAIGKKLRQSFSGDLKTSSKLFTQSRETSKEVHRVTVMFRYMPFKIGDVIEFRGKEYEVNRFGAKVELKEKRSGKRDMYPYEEIIKYGKRT